MDKDHKHIPFAVIVRLRMVMKLQYRKSWISMTGTYQS